MAHRVPISVKISARPPASRTLSSAALLRPMQHGLRPTLLAGRRRAGRLHQHHVARAAARRAASATAASTSATSTDSSPHEPSRLRRVRSPRAASPTTTSWSTPSRTASLPTASCSSRPTSPSSRISPSTATVRAAAPGRADRGQRLERGPHRVGVGVVGVVDDGHPVGAVVRPPSASGDSGRRRASALGDSSSGMPERERDRGRGRGVGAWCSPTSRSAPSASLGRRAQRERGRPPSSSATSRDAHVGVGGAPNVHDRAGSRRHRRAPAGRRR